jgi:Na+-transporting methylmalonyl-CoA/oxaloacetate decarboxylase gamma subunit
MTILTAFLLCTLNIFTTYGRSEDDSLRKMQVSEVLSAQHQLTLGIKINEAHDAIELDLSGPTDVYFSIGFGNDVMVDTWSIVVNGDGDDGWFEQMLSNHRPGLRRKKKSFTMLANTFTAQNNLRRLHVKKSLTSMKDYHPFSVDNDQIDIIWAVGGTPDFSEHVEFGTKTLIYKIDGADNGPAPPHDIWVYFGDMNLSAMIVVVGMGFIFLLLVAYWLYKFIKRLQTRAQIHKYGETEPLVPNKDKLSDKSSVNSSSDIHNDAYGTYIRL